MALTVRETRPLTPIRRAIATRLGASYRDAIHVPLFREAEIEAVLRAERPIHSSTGARPNFIDFVLKATALALVAHPQFNARLENGQLQLIEEINLGLALDAPKGLVVPVIHGVAALALEEISKKRRELTEKVLAWKHTMADLADGTFTISNMAALGIDAVAPIINPPQVAILGLGRIRRKLALAEGQVKQVAVATLCLSFDHRVVDGAESARFLSAIATSLERPALAMR